MGYIIAYDGAEPCAKPAACRTSRLSLFTLGFFLAFLLLTKLFWPAGSDHLMRFFLPGDPEVTGQAVTVLIDNLREGEPVEDALKTFCGEIITHAKYPD